MANIDKIKVGSTIYNIAASSNANNTFTSGDVADGSATEWTTVAALTSGETTSSILGKISNMFKNIRFLYKRIGTSKITISSTITGAINALDHNESENFHMIKKINNIQAVTLAADAWSGSGPYTQSVSISAYGGDSVTAEDRPEIFFNASSVAQADAEQYSEECGYINNIETGEGVLNISAYAKPTLPIYIDVKGV